jgi:hypothetical protein
MTCVIEPSARLANRQDKTRGAFFEERFNSVAILDEESLLATCTYTFRRSQRMTAKPE